MEATSEGRVLWTPTEAAAAATHIERYRRWLRARGTETSDYADLWRWSVREPEAFWTSLLDHFEIQTRGSRDPALASRRWTEARWFPGLELNYATQTRYKVTGSEVLGPGPNVARMEFHYDGGGLGKGGTVGLFVDEQKVGEGRVEKTAWSRFTIEDFDIGADTGSPVSADYASPNRFTGTLTKVVIDTQPPSLSAADQEILRSLERRARVATE